MTSTGSRADVVVLNFGGPASAGEVVPFLRALFNDPDVIKLPYGGPRLQSFVAEQICKRRGPKVISQYEEIGFSPIVPTTLRQVEALRGELTRRLGTSPRIHVGMRYTEPSIAKMTEALAKDPPERVVALALYPHYSGTTTGSSFNGFAQELKARGLGKLPVHYIPAFYDHPRYLAAMRSLILEALSQVRDPQSAHLLFSAHGLPASYYREADPYPDQIHDTVRILVRELSWTRPYSLAFQSKVGPARWLAPSTEAEIHRIAAGGAKEIVIVPISFVSDHIETLYEIDVTFREFAEKHGAKLIRTRALDEHPELIGCLADLVAQALGDTRHGGLGAHRCVRCLLPKPHEHRMRVQCMDCGHQTPEYLLRLPPVRGG